MNPGTRRLGRAALAAGLIAAAAGAAAQGADRFAACVACHGEGGVSRLPETPSLAGQPSFYAITQLFLFREGRRDNPAMSAVAKGMTDTDLRAYSEWIGRLPPAPPADPAPPDAARIARGKALAERHRCASCHGAAYGGDKQVARLAGQREEYLTATLAAFKAGKRIGYTPAMNETLAVVAAEELPDLAHYLAQLGSARP